ncbi:Alkali-sensitive linkage protein 1 [Cytospora mali]|uniref:Alkali-sensitive linkage protein 1 n=1 Tax=Cytospora mali TaxID=578113 RepID=A0A194VJX5_CYTMA|nr:Alkali-sensitive linkage protein 1 [Valsa mali]
MASLLFILALITYAQATPVSKRGLCFVPNSTTPQDDFIWTNQPSTLTWYYNYASSPSHVFANITQEQLEFVPMLWGAPANINDTIFLDTVKAMINNGINIRNVLTFNEPEMSQYGGSGVDPAIGAEVWVNNIIPLQKMGIRAGLPAPSGSMDGLPWLRQFLGNCSEIIGEDCLYDFTTVHWYGNFAGLASHIGEYRATFPNTSIWVTEYNLDNAALRDTQSFYNISADYMDHLLYVERYSLFGAFRSSVSNVGPNATMLSSEGNLTDIGKWYLEQNKHSRNHKPKGTAALIGPTAVPLLLSVVLATGLIIVA